MLYSYLKIGPHLSKLLSNIKGLIFWDSVQLKQLLRCVSKSKPLTFDYTFGKCGGYVLYFIFCYMSLCKSSTQPYVKTRFGQPLPWTRPCLRNSHRNVNARMTPEPHHQHAVELDFASFCQTCPTSRWKLWRSHCRSIDVERKSPAAVAAEPSACHCRWSHESLADQSGRRRQAAMADRGCSD